MLDMRVHARIASASPRKGSLPMAARSIAFGTAGPIELFGGHPSDS